MVYNYIRLMILACLSIYDTIVVPECLIDFGAIYYENNRVVFSIIPKYCRGVKLNTSQNMIHKTKGNLLWIKLDKKEDFNFSSIFEHSNKNHSIQYFKVFIVVHYQRENLTVSFGDAKPPMEIKSGVSTKKNCILSKWTVAKSLEDKIKLSFVSNCMNLYIFSDQKYQKINDTIIIPKDSYINIYQKIGDTYGLYEAFASQQIRSGDREKQWVCLLKNLKCKEVKLQKTRQRNYGKESKKPKLTFPIIQNFGFSSLNEENVLVSEEVGLLWLRERVQNQQETKER